MQRLLDVTSPPSKHIFIFVIQAVFLPLYVHHHIQFALYSFPVVGVKYQYRSTQNANVTIYLFYDLTRSIARPTRLDYLCVVLVQATPTRM